MRKKERDIERTKKKEIRKAWWLGRQKSINKKQTKREGGRSRQRGVKKQEPREERDKDSIKKETKKTLWRRRQGKQEVEDTERTTKEETRKTWIRSRQRAQDEETDKERQMKQTRVHEDEGDKKSIRKDKIHQIRT
jgi:hypothetical protein